MNLLYAFVSCREVLRPHGQCSGFVFHSGPSELAFLNRSPSFSLGRAPCSLGQSATLGEERWPLTQPREFSLSPQELQRYVWLKVWVKHYGLGMHNMDKKVVTMEKTRQAIIWVMQRELYVLQKPTALFIKATIIFFCKYFWNNWLSQVGKNLMIWCSCNPPPTFVPRCVSTTDWGSQDDP